MLVGVSVRVDGEVAVSVGAAVAVGVSVEVAVAVAVGQGVGQGDRLLDIAVGLSDILPVFGGANCHMNTSDTASKSAAAVQSTALTAMARLAVSSSRRSTPQTITSSSTSGSLTG